uniref:MCOI-like protein n=1 Tax=Bactrocera dorsalis TaxID=27457 RepID=A0A1D6ZM09_BACDO|nr:MCOI-like protein [Bactrocera dorsalis]
MRSPKIGDAKMCASVINQINTDCVSSSHNNKNNNNSQTIINTTDCDVMSHTNNRRQRCEFTATTRVAARKSTMTLPSTSLPLALLVLSTTLLLLCALKPANAAATATATNKNAREIISNSDVEEKSPNPKATVIAATTTRKAPSVCSVVIDDKPETREIGAVWVSSQDACNIHTCEQDENGAPRETITNVDCGQFYCDVDSELRPQPGSCCGECVRTKCRFNDTVYELGQTWHSPDGCTMYECAPLPEHSVVTPMINVFEKTCAPLPLDCPREQVYVKDCCQQCRGSETPMSRSTEMREQNGDIWTEEFYRNHPCVRECQPNADPMTCRYNFVVEWYETMSKACYGCPQNGTDCERPHCVLGDGIERSVMVVNRMMPGPSIEVCEGDMIVVDVHNHLLGDSTTIHWHGMHQRNYPYMDGVPHISQCPISPHSTFRYRFRAENSGTHFWHSHTGMQRGDGVFGALIVRRPRATEAHEHLYDFDLSEHKMILQDWVHTPGVSIFSSHHHSRGDNKPVNLLVNGRGRFYYAIWDQAKKEARAGTVDKPNIKEDMPVTPKPTTTTTTPTPTTSTTPSTFVLNQSEVGAQYDLTPSQIELLHPPNDTSRNNMRLRNINEISRLTNVAQQPPPQSDRSDSESEVEFDLTAQPTNVQRTKRAVDDIQLHQMPLQIFHVRRGFRYRFRIINAEFLNCPIALSIDNHTLLAINSDGYDFEPLEVGAIVTYAGERFDFVLNANQSVGNYWIRFKGLMDCSDQFTSAFQVGILRYEGAGETEPNGVLGWQHKADGIELNAMNRGSGHPDSLTAAEMTALPIYDTVPGVDRDVLKPVADYKFFVYYDFYAKDNPVFHPGDYYSFNDSLGKTNKLYTPQLNHISLKMPPMALMPDRNNVDDSLFCNDTSLAQQGIDCRKDFCNCHHVLQVPLNSVVELIMVDEGFTFDANHPFHLHGNAFRVVGLERLGSNVTIEMVKQLDRYNLLKRNLDRPPIKDTVTIPDGGYTILRFEAYNPGFWLFHCHIEFHAEIGMALIIKVGDNDQMKSAPKNFPTCHDYMPKDGEDEIEEDSSEDKNDNTATSAPITTPSTGGAVAQSAQVYSVLSALLVLGALHWSRLAAVVGIH